MFVWQDGASEEDKRGEKRHHLLVFANLCGEIAALGAGSQQLVSSHAGLKRNDKIKSQAHTLAEEY